MILTSDIRYEYIPQITVDASGELVCPVCSRYVHNVKSLTYSEYKDYLFVTSEKHGVSRSTQWRMSDDLAILCSDQCLYVHNLLGGVYT